MRRILLTFAALALAAPPSPANPYASARTPAAAQCPRADRAVTRKVRFARGRTTAVIKDTVRLCTSHDWALRARGGQTMTVHIATGNRTSFTVQTPSGDTIEDADGVKDWSGELPETGDYLIIVGTDATAAYTLEVTIR